MALQNTTCTLEIKNGYHTFIFSVCRDNVGFVVSMDQTTKVNHLEGLEDVDDFRCNWRYSCKYAKTEHSAIHEAGAKLLKNWNKKGRIGKDKMILSDSN